MPIESMKQAPAKKNMTQRCLASGRATNTLVRTLLALLLAVSLTVDCLPRQLRASPARATSATILLYHRFGRVTTGATTVRTSVFEEQMKFLREHNYNVVRLRDVVEFVEGRGQLPERAVAITADDGHRTVFTEMKPIVERYRIPVTLFIYPSAISNASYAMTWEQLKQLQATGLFDIESHTYWHPNFRIEKRRLSPADYQQLVDSQLRKSREVLQRRLGSKVDLLAWPFGINDSELIAAARRAGYVAAFTIERRQVSRRDNPMAIPRFTVRDSDVGKAFQSLLAGREL